MTRERGNRKNRRVLAVDDSVVLLEMYQKLFRSSAAQSDADEGQFKSVSALEQILKGEELSPQRKPKGSVSKSDVEEYCQREPFDLVCCTQGYDAVEEVHKAILANRPFAVALIDMRMPPGIDGMDTALRIRTIDKGLQIIFITANSDYDTDETCSRVGGQVLFFRKPFQNEELYQTVRNACWSWNQSHELRMLQLNLESRIELQTRRLQERVHSMELLQKNSVLREQEMGRLKRENRYLRTYQDLRLLLSADPLPMPQPVDELEGRQLHLLVVDDVDIVRMLFGRHMEAIGFRVTLAESVTEGMSIALSDPPDIALIDYQMPGGNGDLLIQQMHDNQSTAQILAILFTSVGNEMIAIESGAAYWMHKEQEPTLFQQKMGLVRDHVIARNRAADDGEQSAVALLKLFSENKAEQLVNNRILLIDDQQENLDTLSLILGAGKERQDENEQELFSLVGIREEGRSAKQPHHNDPFEITALNQGEDAVEEAMKMQLAGTPFAVALIDMRMPPGIDGLETAKQLRQISPHIEIVILTAYSDYSLANIRQVLGANFSFMSKPYTEDVVLQRVIEGCARWGINDEKHGAHLALLNLAEDMQQEIVLRRQTEKELEEANQSKDSFFSSMSHELRTPLTTIIGFNELLLSDSTVERHHKELLENILLAGKTLLQLVNDILDMSKIRAGKFELNDQPFDLHRMVQDINALMSVSADSKGVKLHLEVADAVRPLLRKQWVGDEMRISQVLFNLLSNAVKFSDHGEVILRLGVNPLQRIAVPGFHSFELQIEDYGIGMSDEVRSRLFTPFEQADSKTSSRFGGTGLGLYISQQLIKMMGGEIHVESILNIGSTFTVELPLKVTDLDVESEAQENQSRDRKQKVPQLRGRVLLAEDTLQLQRLEIMLIEKTGAKVDGVVNGVEALEKGRSGDYQLILMDMQMPEMDGIEATRRLRENRCNSPIVALTANVMQKDRDKFEAAGCDGFLPKPINQAQLYSILEKYLDAAERVVDDSPSISPYISSPVVEETAVESFAIDETEEGEDFSDMIDEEMWQDFWNYLKEARTELEKAWEGGDWEQIRGIAHAIKGMGSSYGQVEMTQVAKQLQDYALEGDSEKLAPHYHDLLKLIGQGEGGGSNT
ncbi:MAG: response regulator [Gammaproteobacteria bacterium]|jgi:signal transduction histidine kinase/AmiR/NasT family two-component response regulator|nr:response regulator [Gammaproteobacteria bacterium]MBT3489054.1 response regulator [Gammaproteobacteria bacterium]MBT3719587.1 response regulator [Gammaproteobacteria bacterium]MBT3845709.1 response regulator [Gammaproteobacteria bacterium]MBT3892639.1 response regulator [Gammaproteobacteria bacterium]